ncbi:unnamed protein product [Rhodiola kirilowii]
MAIGDSSNLLRFIILLTLAFTVVNSTSTAELDSTLAALRSHNYNLFANALTTSDLLFELHSNLTTHDNASITRSFTLFAPPDSALFALDMTATALVYTQTLRYHVVPRRIAAADLLRLPPGSCLPTLLTWREIRVHRRQLRRAAVIAVDGVNVVVPGLFYGEGVAVHGLAGVLNFRSQIAVRHGWSAVSETNRTGSVSPENSTASFPANQTFIPQIPKQTVANGSAFSPIPRLPVFNHSIPPPDVNLPLPSACISSPPETMLTREGTPSPQISPVTDESSKKLIDLLTDDQVSTERVRRHSVKLLEIGELSLTDFDDDAAGDNLLTESHKVETLKSDPVDVENENVVGQTSDDDEALMSDGLSHYTGYEL